MRLKLNEVSMNNDDKSKVILEKVSTIWNHYVCSEFVIKDEDFVASIMTKIPKVYSSNFIIQERVQEKN